eukprot:673607-Pelagomonas_calceolata.AAC.2
MPVGGSLPENKHLQLAALSTAALPIAASFPPDQAVLLEIMASCGLAIKVLLLASLVRLMGEKRLLMFGIAAYALQVSRCCLVWFPPLLACLPKARVLLTMHSADQGPLSTPWKLETNMLFWPILDQASSGLAVQVPS